eukprot:g483.t1
MSGASTLERAPIDLVELREEGRSNLVDVLDCIDVQDRTESLCLVLDPRLAGPLNHIISEGGSFFPNHGVKDCRELNWADLDTDCGHVLYLVRPIIPLMKQIAKQIHTHQRSHPNKTHSLSFVPRRSFICEQVLKDEGVYADIRIVPDFQLGLIPFDDDVLSLEIESCFKECHLDGNRSSLHYVATSLLQLQSLYGVIPNVVYKGELSAAVAQLMVRLRDEGWGGGKGGGGGAGGVGAGGVGAGGVGGGDFGGGAGGFLGEAAGGAGGLPEIDTVLLIDRKSDMVSPLVTPLTYEGLIDELVGIKYSYIHVDAALLAPTDKGDGKGGAAAAGAGAGAAAAAAAAAAGARPGQKIPLPLNSNDKLYAEIRDFHITAVLPRLLSTARSLQDQENERLQADSLEAIHDFVKNIPELQQEKLSLSHQINITELLNKTTNDHAFRRRWEVEQAILQNDRASANIDYIEERVARQDPLLQVLRLLCLQSLTGGGLKAKQFDQLRREVLQTYGCELIFTLDHLEKLGLFKPALRSGADSIFGAMGGGVTGGFTGSGGGGGSGGSGGSGGGASWSSLRKQFQLLEEDVTVDDPTSIAYVTSGYAPLICRLVEVFMQRGWKPCSDLMRSLPGPHGVITQGAHGVGSSSSSGGGGGGGGSSGDGGAGAGTGAAGGEMRSGKRKVLLVYFIGGVTFMEISALRLLSLRDDCNYEIIVATTKLVNGNTLMQTLLHDVENKLVR